MSKEEASIILPLVTPPIEQECVEHFSKFIEFLAAFRYSDTARKFTYCEKSQSFLLMQNSYMNIIWRTIRGFDDRYTHLEIIKSRFSELIPYIDALLDKKRSLPDKKGKPFIDDSTLHVCQELRKNVEQSDKGVENWGKNSDYVHDTRISGPITLLRTVTIPIILKKLDKLLGQTSGQECY